MPPLEGWMLGSTSSMRLWRRSPPKPYHPSPSRPRLKALHLTSDIASDEARPAGPSSTPQWCRERRCRCSRCWPSTAQRSTIPGMWRQVRCKYFKQQGGDAVSVRAAAHKADGSVALSALFYRAQPLDRGAERTGAALPPPPSAAGDSSPTACGRLQRLHRLTPTRRLHRAHTQGPTVCGQPWPHMVLDCDGLLGGGSLQPNHVRAAAMLPLYLPCCLSSTHT